MVSMVSIKLKSAMPFCLIIGSLLIFSRIHAEVDENDNDSDSGDQEDFFKCEKSTNDFAFAEDNSHYFDEAHYRQYNQGLFNKSFFEAYCQAVNETHECLKQVEDKIDPHQLFYFDHGHLVDACEWVLPNENLRQCLGKIHDEYVQKCHPKCGILDIFSEMNLLMEANDTTPMIFETFGIKKFCGYQECFNNCVKNDKTISCDTVADTKDKYVSFLERRSMQDKKRYSRTLESNYNLTMADEGCEIVSKFP